MSSVLGQNLSLKRPQAFHHSVIYKNWRKVVGESIAENTLELRVEANILHVAVNSSTWAHELINRQTTFLQQLREYGHQNLDEFSIRVRVPKSPKAPRQKKKPEKPRTISPAMQELFARLASESKNQEAKEIYMRMSRVPTRD